MNLDDLEHSINNVTKKLYPIVIESILNEQVFDFAEVMNQSYKTKGCCSNASCCGWFIYKKISASSRYFLTMF